MVLRWCCLQMVLRWCCLQMVLPTMVLSQGDGGVKRVNDRRGTFLDEGRLGCWQCAWGAPGPCRFWVGRVRELER